jgi:ubiquinone/menaquinone biosynthesis C-methylase UbiE
MCSSSYDQWAEIYDTVYSYVRDDIPFYVDEARRAGGPVLELGCGTGRVAIPVFEAGVDVVGLDFSPAMLDVARRKIHRREDTDGALTLVQADMRDFRLDRKFPLITIPFRGFLSLMTVEDQTRALLNVKRHLAPDGKLVFNVFVPDLEMLVQEGDVAYHLRDVTAPDTGTVFVVWSQSSYDNHAQIINARIIVDELDAEGAAVGRIYRDFQLRYVHRWEMHHLLELCGYEVMDLFGDFDRTPFDETSTEMVWVAGARG